MDKQQLLNQLQQFPDSWLQTSEVATLLGIPSKQVSQLKSRNLDHFTLDLHHNSPKPGKSMEWSLAGLKVLCELSGNDDALATLEALQSNAVATIEETLPQPSSIYEDTHLQQVFATAGTAAEDAFVSQAVQQLKGQTQAVYASHLATRIEEGLAAQATELRGEPAQVAQQVGELLALRFGLSPEVAQQVVGL